MRTILLNLWPDDSSFQACRICEICPKRGEVGRHGRGETWNKDARGHATDTLIQKDRTYENSSMSAMPSSRANSQRCNRDLWDLRFSHDKACSERHLSKRYPEVRKNHGFATAIVGPQDREACMKRPAWMRDELSIVISLSVSLGIVLLAVVHGWLRVP